ncbi:Uncharacterised protein [Mycobacteroides abscessus subsp. abscessus]|nr:Uncharacterised protein [Mycobacteroides abscessus subsp. abscessus]
MASKSTVVSTAPNRSSHERSTADNSVSATP